MERRTRTPEERAADERFARGQEAPVEGVAGRAAVAPAVRVEEHPEEYWRDRTRIFLRPVASPVVLGWLAWAAAAFVVASEWAWGYGEEGARSLTALGPYIAFMGLAQLFAAMWGYNARDTLATAFHGIWGATWLGFGIFTAFVLPNELPNIGESLFGAGQIDEFPAFGYMFLATGAATVVLAPYGFAKNMVTGITMMAVGAASVFIFLEAVVGGEAWSTVAGWTYLGAVVGALLIAGATTVTYAFNSAAAYKLLGPAAGRGADGQLDGRILSPVDHDHGEPGVRQGEGARSDMLS